MIRAMWAEVKRTFRPPRTPWEEWWWNDEFLQTGQWLGFALALPFFVGSCLLLPHPSGGAMIVVLVTTFLLPDPLRRGGLPADAVKDPSPRRER